jgi:hypothetical protein
LSSQTKVDFPTMLVRLKSIHLEFELLSMIRK